MDKLEKEEEELGHASRGVEPGMSLALSCHGVCSPCSIRSIYIAIKPTCGEPTRG